ncbi:MAG: extracellular solute-binding protein, partial [Kiritimatiellae bacterium]|nr:extracellular solute-binding protein [Kiritimatiellia bacterium]
MVKKVMVRNGVRVVCLAVFWLTVACSTRQEDRTEDGRIIVIYWEKWTGFEAEAMQAVVDDFNASQDRVEVRMLPVSGILDKLMLATAGGNPPDVAGLWTHSITEFSEKGALTPLDAFLENSSIRQENYIPVYWELCRNHGFLWALPTTPASLALHWNKRLFREAGLDPDSPPTSLAELNALSDKLTIVRIERHGEWQQVRYPDLTPEEKASRGFRILQVGHIPTVPGWYSEMWGFWFGGRMWDGDSRITANSPENIEAFTWYQSHAEKLGVNNLRTFGQTFGNFASPQSPFMAGKVAMVLQG